MELNLIELEKSYGNTMVLKGINCSFKEGIYGLLGPNGAGKSTLMNLIVDNLKPDKGEIRYNNIEILSLGKNYRSKIGFMPQQQGMYDNFTAKQFLNYIAALKGMRSKGLSDKIDHVLELVNLKDEANKKLAHYSGGMKQRVLIAQTILDEPDILIFDEPTAGLDPKERIRIRNLISKISLHKIVIIATHVVSDIEFIAHKILLLNKGELLSFASPLELLKEMEGKVYELCISEEYLDDISLRYQVVSVFHDSDGIKTRIISEETPEEYRYKLVKPILEDVYLYRFGNEL